MALLIGLLLLLSPAHPHGQPHPTRCLPVKLQVLCPRPGGGWSR